MAQKDARSIQAELARPFAPEDLEWRLQKAFESRGGMVGIAVPFVTNRAIMNRLDAVVGPENWYNDFKPWHAAGKKEAQICGISIFFEGKGFITKWDGAEDSDIEPIKGGLSDSMKRAAVQWGIGRVLYNMDAVFVEVEQRGKSWVIKKDQRAKLDKAYMDMLKTLKLEAAPADGVQSLLTGGGPEEARSRPQGSSTPAIPNGNTSPAGKGVERPAPRQTSQPAAYTVTAMRMQKGMSGINTQVKLKSAEGKEINAFVQGEHPMLVSGTALSEAKLTMRKQDTVVYYILESYQIYRPEREAA